MKNSGISRQNESHTEESLEEWWGEAAGLGGGESVISWDVMFLFIKSGMRSPQMIPLDVSPGNEACSFQRG